MHKLHRRRKEIQMEAKFLISGDTAISVQLGDEISLDVNQKVRGLLSELTKNPVTGVTEMVPTYASLMVHYKIGRASCRERV